MRTDIPDYLKQMTGYYLVNPNTSISMKYSRQVLLVREGIKINIMDDCMAMNVPDIWVKVTAKGKKP